MLDLKNGTTIEIIKNKVRLNSANPPLVLDIDISNTGRVLLSANGNPLAGAENLEELINKMKPYYENLEVEGKNHWSIKSFFGL